MFLFSIFVVVVGGDGGVLLVFDTLCPKEIYHISYSLALFASQSVGRSVSQSVGLFLQSTMDLNRILFAGRYHGNHGYVLAILH